MWAQVRNREFAEGEREPKTKICLNLTVDGLVALSRAIL